jgi:hypothetical protein
VRKSRPGSIVDDTQRVLLQFPMLDKVDLLKFCQTKRQFTEGVKMVMARDMTNFQASAIDDCLKLVGNLSCFTSSTYLVQSYGQEES